MPNGESDVRASLDAVLHNIENDQRNIGFFGNNVALLARATIGLDEKVERGFAKVESDLAAVKGDLAGVKIDLAGVKGDLRKVLAHVETIVGYVARDESRN